MSRPALDISDSTLETLVLRAREAACRAYAPYSEFAVGAAVLTESGDIVTGANVENASLGLCNCAERTAVFAAVSAGARKISCVVIHTPTPTPTPPCGACRQVINEFGPHARVVSVCDSPDRIDTTLDALLPGAFGPGNLDD